jgi:hypothetical protein
VISNPIGKYLDAINMFAVEEVCEDVDETYGLEHNPEQTEFLEQKEFPDEGEKNSEEHQEIQTTQEPQQTYEEQRTSVQKRQSSFCLDMEFGKCGGKISCKGKLGNCCRLHLL